MKAPSISEFEKALLESCKKDTSYHPKTWTSDNPLWGHCTVIALLAQDYFGGAILRAQLIGDHGAKIGWHFINRLDDGKTIDFSQSQYGRSYPQHLRFSLYKRSRLLRIDQVARRYQLLARRVKKALTRL